LRRYSAAWDSVVFSSTTASGARLGAAFVAEAAPRSVAIVSTVLPLLAHVEAEATYVGVHTFSFTLAAEASRAADKDGHLVLEDDLASSLVLGLNDRGDRSSLALVKHLDDLGLVHEVAAGRDWPLDRKILLAVQELSKVLVWQEVIREREPLAGN
jgi:hypothetical protein